MHPTLSFVDGSHPACDRAEAVGEVAPLSLAEWMRLPRGRFVPLAAWLHDGEPYRAVAEGVARETPRVGVAPRVAVEASRGPEQQGVQAPAGTHRRASMGATVAGRAAARQAAVATTARAGEDLTDDAPPDRHGKARALLAAPPVAEVQTRAARVRPQAVP